MLSPSIGRSRTGTGGLPTVAFAMNADRERVWRPPARISLERVAKLIDAAGPSPPVDVRDVLTLITMWSAIFLRITDIFSTRTFSLVEPPASAPTAANGRCARECRHRRRLRRADGPGRRQRRRDGRERASS
jgi:hypothetical protein